MNIQSLLGQRNTQHWAAGYQIDIGPDGIARNVPPDAAEEMLSNPNAWKRLEGHVPPPKGVLRGFGQPAGKTPQRTEIVLVPKTLAMLESLTAEQQDRVARALEFDPTRPPGAPRAREILEHADEQLSLQLYQLAAEPAPAPADEIAAPPAVTLASANATAPGVETKAPPPTANPAVNAGPSTEVPKPPAPAAEAPKSGAASNSAPAESPKPADPGKAKSKTKGTGEASNPGHVSTLED